MRETFTWAPSPYGTDFPPVAIMPCGHDLGKFNGVGVQCCICGKEYDPPKSN